MLPWGSPSPTLRSNLTRWQHEVITMWAHLVQDQMWGFCTLDMACESVGLCMLICWPGPDGSWIGWWGLVACSKKWEHLPVQKAFNQNNLSCIPRILDRTNKTRNTAAPLVVETKSLVLEEFREATETTGQLQRGSCKRFQAQGCMQFTLRSWRF